MAMHLHGNDGVIVFAMPGGGRTALFLYRARHRGNVVLDKE